MKSPLALFRGFQLASGVEPDRVPPLREAVLRSYHNKERMARLYETELVMASARGNTQVIHEVLPAYMEMLFPEMEQRQGDFRKEAAAQMQGWSDKVIEIQGGTARIRKSEDVSEDLMKLHRARLARPAVKKRKAVGG